MWSSTTTNRFLSVETTAGTKDISSSMMEVYLLAPVRSIPMSKRPLYGYLTSAHKEFMQSMNTMLKQALLAYPWQGATVTSGYSGKMILSYLGTCEDSHPGSQGHANQQTFQMLKISHLSLFPVPAIGLVVSEQRLNGVTARIQVNQSVVRWQVTNYTRGVSYPFPQYATILTGRQPRFLKALPRILARYPCLGVKSLTL